MAFVASAMFWGSGALANDIYVEQIGDNTTVTINQTGSANLVEGIDVGQAASIGGDGNIVSINQVGAGNVLKLSVFNSNIGGPGTGATVTATASGNDNIQTISCANSTNANCLTSTITSNITGDNNRTTQTLSGNVVSSVINVTGDYNAVTHTASGAGAHTASITVTGSGTSVASPNLVNLTQSGALAQSATITSNGSNNNISVVQQGQ